MKSEIAEEKVKQQHLGAIQYLKDNKKLLINKFISEGDYEKEDLPVSIFMAGSPGAGKTEFSKGLIDQFENKPLRIDADEIRNFFPEYDRTNSHVFQGACSLGVEKLYDEALRRNINLILDGTFADRDKSIKNISRALKRNRKIQIYYIFQEPKVAWNFTQKRAVVEGRPVPKKVFIDAFLSAKENVNYAKDNFGDKIELNLVIKNLENKVGRFILNIKKIDNHLKFDYNIETLEGIVK